jgi:alkaline phosphatase
LKRMMTVIAVTLTVLGLVASLGWADEAGRVDSGKSRCTNIIVMIPDGCSQSVQTAARWYKRHVLGDPAPLALDTMGTTGMVKTHMANSVITGSAAAATAFATGYKTTARFVSVGPDPDKLPNLTGFASPIAPYAPIQTVLEGAKARGKATGLVATSRITHATPAAFGAHIHDRGLDNEIMEHLVYQEIDVVFGGGKRHLLPADMGGKRTDGENLLQVLFDRGYGFVETAEEMDALVAGRVWGLFAGNHMEADIDRAEFAADQPSLAEMTHKAIELLSRSRRGFFLVVEGSQVDWAGHANDPIHMITDFLAFDAAVKAAMDHADRHPQTLVLVFPDHNTGAMSIGHGRSAHPPEYTQTTVEDLVGPLKEMRITATGVDRKIAEGGGYTVENVQRAIGTWWGLTIDAAAAQAIVDRKAAGMFGNNAIGEVVSKTQTVFGWTTHGHSGEDVPLWSYGRQLPVGLLDNTELAGIVAAACGFSLSGSGAWEAYDAAVVLDSMAIEANPVATVDGVQYPISKDIRIDNGAVTDLLGITVYAPESGKVYIPVE